MYEIAGKPASLFNGVLNRYRDESKNTERTYAVYTSNISD